MVKRFRTPGLESLFCAAFVLFGFGAGVRAISDNSMLTHLRTGIDMARGSGIPRGDPYSYTSRGADWVVQSWLPEWSYGLLYRAGGLRLVVLEQAVIMALLAWLIARLARTGNPLRTAVAAGLAVGLGALFWTPRPFLFGLLCLVLTVTLVERRLNPWWLLPLVWVWVNSHGSFPLGLAWLLARAAGEALDWRTSPRETTPYLWAFIGGLVAAAANPLGARLLAFPFNILDRSEVFERIIEWRSPDFQGTVGRIVLMFLVLTLLTLARSRLAWRDAIPVAGFLGLGLLSVRNVAAAAIVLAPVLGRALRSRREGRRTDRSTSRRLDRAFLTVIVAAFVLFGLSALLADPLELDSYPVAASSYLDDEGYLGPTHRIAHQDVVGNYLEFRFGRRVAVFIDDRYDMYPVALADDYSKLLRAHAEALGILDRRQVDVVLWAADLPLSTILSLSADWQERYRDDDWVVFVRMPTS